jgi:hypothetical protein
MIKRQMRVAIAEEDYVKAAQLRDLPIMTMYHEIQQLRANGFAAEAQRLSDCLDAETSIWRFEES